MKISRYAATAGLAAIVLLALAGCMSSGADQVPGTAAPAVKCHDIASGGCSHGRIGQRCSFAGSPGTITVNPSTGELDCGVARTSVAPPPPPSPVSTAATLTGNCVMGYEWDTNDGDATGIFITGPAPPGDTSGSGAPDPVLAYQVTLTNSSSATADVTGYGWRPESGVNRRAWFRLHGQVRRRY